MANTNKNRTKKGAEQHSSKGKQHSSKGKQRRRSAKSRERDRTLRGQKKHAKELERKGKLAARDALNSIIDRFELFTKCVCYLTALLYDLDIQWTDDDDSYLRTPQYPLIELFVAFTICVCSGANSYRSVVKIWDKNAEFFRAALPNLPTEKDNPGRARAPSYECLRLALLRLRKDAVATFIAVITRSRILNELEASGFKHLILALDGKTDRAQEYEVDKTLKSHQERHLYKREYIVSLFSYFGSVAVDQELVLHKENENKACIRIVKRYCKGKRAIITGDALNTTIKVATAIRAAGSNVHFMLAVKDNNPKLRKAIKAAFQKYQHLAVRYSSPEEKNHGRTKVRYVLCLPASLVQEYLGEWAPLVQSVILAKTISVENKYGKKRQPETRIYISSLPRSETNFAQLAYTAVRAHWGVEAMHYILDVTFKQDRIKFKNTKLHEIRVIINKLALALLRAAGDRDNQKVSIADRRSGGDVSEGLAVLCEALRGADKIAA